jgi:RNA-directed DNA polymerase
MIPKPGGTGERPLGIPTVADRVAQEVVKRYLEPLLEPIFHVDSYGYRLGRSAIDAVRPARQRCWRYDWVLDIDVKGYLDVVSYCPQGYQLCYPRLSVYPIPLFTMTNMRPSMVHSATT